MFGGVLGNVLGGGARNRQPRGGNEDAPAASASTTGGGGGGGAFLPGVLGGDLPGASADPFAARTVSTPRTTPRRAAADITGANSPELLSEIPSLGAGAGAGVGFDDDDDDDDDEFAFEAAGEEPELDPEPAAASTPVAAPAGNAAARTPSASPLAGAAARRFGGASPFTKRRAPLPAPADLGVIDDEDLEDIVM